MSYTVIHLILSLTSFFLSLLSFSSFVLFLAIYRYARWTSNSLSLSLLFLRSTRSFFCVSVRFTPLFSFYENKHRLFLTVLRTAVYLVFGWLIIIRYYSLSFFFVFVNGYPLFIDVHIYCALLHDGSKKPHSKYI